MITCGFGLTKSFEILKCFIIGSVLCIGFKLFIQRIKIHFSVKNNLATNKQYLVIINKKIIHYYYLKYLSKCQTSNSNLKFKIIVMPIITSVL